MNLKPAISLFYRDTQTWSDNSQIQVIGTLGQTQDGRQYRWVKVGAATLVPGNVLSAPTANGSQVDLAVNTALTIVGATAITVTPGAAISANQYRGGQLLVSNGAGIGLAFTIASHAAGNDSVKIVFHVDSSEVVNFTADADTRVDLVFNKYDGVIQTPASEASLPVAVSVAPITNAQYGWAGTDGSFPVLCAGAPILGYAVCPSDGTAGAVEEDANTVYSPCGTMQQTGVSGKVKMVSFKF